MPTNSEAGPSMGMQPPTGRDRAHDRRPRAVALAASAVALLLPACGGEDRVPLYPAGGRVEVDGKPVEGIEVVLHPSDRVGDLDAFRPRGKTGPDGSFALGTFEEGDGAPAGRYVATLFWPDVPPGPTPPDDLLGGRYASPSASGLDVTIPEGPTQLEPFRVEGLPASAAARRPRSAATPDVDGMTGPGG